MVNDRIALHSACAADPEDNTRHLAYADWLDENGTSDADAARVEWIRLTCGKVRKSVTNRQAGERDWITKNAARLWPRLWESTGDAARYNVKIRLFDWQRLQLTTGALNFRVLIPHKTRRGTSLVASVVNLRGRRGVVHSATVTALRAATTAPLVAADEPLTPIRFAGMDVRSIPFCGVDYQYTWAWMDKRSMVQRGLLGVWNELSGFDKEVVTENSVQRRYTIDMHPQPIKTATDALNAALTRWARGVAGVPHVVGKPLYDLSLWDDPSPVSAPPRV